MLQVNFEPVSNREQWSDTIEVRRNGALVDLSAATIVFSVRDKNSLRVMLNATTANGAIEIESTGVFNFTFSVAQMRNMNASVAYEVGCTIDVLSDGAVEQFLIGKISILDGIVD